jgi:GNAT superfamily N-acetyltransferase
MSRFEARTFTPEAIPAAAELLAERHRRQRIAWPALDPTYEDSHAVEPLIAELLEREGASGTIVHAGVEPAAYVLGHRRPDVPWGANAWVDAAGSAGADHEAIRIAYAAAAEGWVAEGRTQHYVVVPATDGMTLDAWFSLSFGMQHVHGLQPVAATGLRPSRDRDIITRPATPNDVEALVAIDPVLPEHSGGSPIFSPVPIPTRDDAIEEITQDLTDERFFSLVAEREGRVVGTTTACAIQLSPGNTPLMRPRSCGLLGFAAVLLEARGLGVGRALADAVMDWAREQRYEWLGADWRSTNIEADRTWRAAGFRPSFYRLHRSIV